LKTPAPSNVAEGLNDALLLPNAKYIIECGKFVAISASAASTVVSDDDSL